MNGVPTKWIKTKRGLHQGDPLSPFLFLLVAECLAGLTEAGSNRMLRGVGPTDNTKITILQYAVDTIFFCEARKKQARNLLFMWQIFEWASGLKINQNKSELFYMEDNTQLGSGLAGILGCKLSSLPIRYLGLPLTVRRLTKEDWQLRPWLPHLVA